MFGVHIWRFEYFGAKLNGVGEGAMIVNSPILFITFFVYMDAHFFIIPWFIKNTYGALKMTYRLLTKNERTIKYIFLFYR